MRALYWSCMAIVSVVIGDAVGCGGRLMVADCGQDRQYCAETNVCCPNFTICGDGKNGCAPGDCCLNTTAHIADGGSDGSDADPLTPMELPPPDMGPGGGGPNDPSNGSLPGNGGGGGAGGGGGSSAPPLGGDKRS
jgi:hypothetical protein